MTKSIPLPTPDFRTLFESAPGLNLAVMENMGEGLYTVDTQGLVTYMNPAAERLFGWSSAELLGRKMHDMTHYQHPDGRPFPAHECAGLQVLQKGTVLSDYEDVFIRRDGTFFPVVYSSSPLMAQGKITGLVVVFRDVTAHRQAEQALRQSEARKTAILETALDCIITINHEGEIIDFNPAAERTFGYRRADVLGREMADLMIPPALQETHRRGLAHYLATGEGPVLDKRLELTAVRADGTEFPVELAITRIPMAGPPLFTGYLRDITERKRAAEKLQASEVRYRSLVESSLQGILIHQNGLILYANPMFAQMFGYDSSGELIGRNCFETFPALEERSALLARSAASYRGEPVLPHLGWRGVRKDGTTIWVATTACRIDWEGEPAILTCASDVTERTLAEEEIREAEERMRSVVNHVIDGIITIDDGGIVESFNPAAEKIFGYVAAEVVGKNVKMLMPEPYHGEHDGYVANYLSTRQAKIIGIGREVVGRRKDGSTFPMDLAVSEFQLGQSHFFTGIVRDITERKRAEDALRESEERFRLLVEAVEDYAIYLLDPEGHVVSWNIGAERIKGYSAEEIIGQHCSRFFPPEDVRQGKPELELKMAAFEGTYEDEAWRVRKDGTRFWANVVITALHDPSGNLKGFSKIIRDITERRRVQQALRRSRDELEERVRERTVQLQRTNHQLEQFAYVASHDLQEPLRKIQAFGDRLQQACGEALGEQGRDYLGRMQTSATRMRSLIDALLALSRLTTAPGHFVPVDLAQVTQEVVADLEGRIQQTGGRVELGDLPCLDADLVQMQQLLQNLVGNALKFHRADEPPVVRVEGRIYSGSPESGEVAPSEPLCQITVQDNGIGFAEAYLDRIFEVFQRLHGREYEGTGMGLAICRKIVERHGGTITAKSAPGQGSTFIVTLPQRQSNQEKHHEEAPQTHHDFDGG